MKLHCFGGVVASDWRFSDLISSQASGAHFLDDDVARASQLASGALLNLLDDDVASSGQRQVGRAGHRLDGDVASSGNARREVGDGAIFHLDVPCATGQEFGGGHLLGVDVPGARLCDEWAAGCADEGVANDADDLDRGLLGNLDEDLGRTYAVAAAGDDRGHAAATKVADDRSDDEIASDADRGGLIGTSAAPNEERAAFLDNSADGLDLVLGAGDGVLDGVSIVGLHLDIGDDVSHMEGVCGEPHRPLGDFGRVIAGLAKPDVTRAIGLDLARGDVTPAAVHERDARVVDAVHLLVGVDGRAVHVGDDVHVPFPSREIRL